MGGDPAQDAEVRNFEAKETRRVHAMARQGSDGSAASDRPKAQTLKVVALVMLSKLFVQTS
jgi:hypothetical protein